MYLTSRSLVIDILYVGRKRFYFWYIFGVLFVYYVSPVSDYCIIAVSNKIDIFWFSVKSRVVDNGIFCSCCQSKCFCSEFSSLPAAFGAIRGCCSLWKTLHGYFRKAPCYNGNQIHVSCLLLATAYFFSGVKYHIHYSLGSNVSIESLVINVTQRSY